MLYLFTFVVDVLICQATLFTFVYVFCVFLSVFSPALCHLLKKPRAFQIRRQYSSLSSSYCTAIVDVVLL